MARVPYDVTVWLDRGYARVGEKITASFEARSLDGKPVDGEAKAFLYSTNVNQDGKIEEKEVANWKPAGKSWAFEASKPGQYRLALEFTDQKGRSQEGATVFSVLGAENKSGGDFQYNDLELIPDKKEYQKAFFLLPVAKYIGTETAIPSGML